MRFSALALLAALSLGACMRSDPRVSAAEDFRQTAFGLIREDEERAEKLASLRIGMSDTDVLNAAGPPSSRESRTAYDDAQVETWTYNGQLKTLGTLTFEDQKLVQVKVY
jgi:hypothetical protein